MADVKRRSYITTLLYKPVSHTMSLDKVFSYFFFEKYFCGALVLQHEMNRGDRNACTSCMNEVSKSKKRGMILFCKLFATFSK